MLKIKSIVKMSGTLVNKLSPFQLIAQMQDNFLKVMDFKSLESTSKLIKIKEQSKMLQIAFFTKSQIS